MTRNLILLDADGVLVDYHEGYAMAWERAFGYRPAVRDPAGYHPTDYWDVPFLNEAQRQHLTRHGFTEEVWASLPAMPGAVEACELLQAQGWTLGCLTALRPQMQGARAHNLTSLGFQMSTVKAVGADAAGNPKREELHRQRPVAFVDDFLGFLQDLPDSTWSALIEGRPNFSPNTRSDVQAPHSRHPSLLDFAERWPSLQAHASFNRSSA